MNYEMYNCWRLLREYNKRRVRMMELDNLPDEPIILGETPPSSEIKRKTVNVRGRKEHESFLKDPKKCEEHGLDIVYERMVYLKRWGGWLDEENGEV